MKAWLVLAAALLVTVDAGAEPSPQFTTAWMFSIDYGNGTVSTDADPLRAGPIMVPTGSRWKCKRDPVTMNPTGVLVGGYSCSDGPSSLSVYAWCAGAKGDVSIGRARLVEATTQNYLEFTTSCVTTQVTTKKK